MRSGAIAFLAGVLVFFNLPELPNPWWSAALPAVLIASVRLPGLRPLIWLGTGFFWTLFWVYLFFPPAFPEDWETVDLGAEGWVASIPEVLQRGTRFRFQVETLRRGDILLPFAGALRLSWYNGSPALKVGDKWSLTVQLRRPRGLSNPGGFDYERWLLANGFAAQGYVRSRPEPRLLQRADRYPLNRFRQQVAERFAQQLPGNPYVGILTALAVGEEHAISQTQWEILTRTGTGHLMSISGSHIGLVAGLALVGISRIWGWCPVFMRRWPAKKAAALGATLAAGGYTLLSGLAVPSQRAFIMIFVAMLALLGQRPVVPSRILALALLVVLVIEPPAPLTAGFWLSFGAVAAIMYAVVGRPAENRLFGQWLGLQLSISLALLPATLVFFQQIAVLSPLANLIAIPWSGLTVIPLTLLAALLGVVSSTAESGLLQFAALTLDWLWRFLAWVAGLPWAMVYYPAPPLWTLVFAVPGLLLMLAPAGAPCRWLGAVLCLSLACFRFAAPAPEAVWFTLLDVGQSLAAVVRTAQHSLVYDTGPWRSASFDAGRTAVLPFLYQQGLSRLDALLISHADNEHMGGTRSLLEGLKVDMILTSSPLEVPIEEARPCRAGVEWNWDGVRFRVLHPAEGAGFFGNNASCVLLVESRHGRVLLTGDIGPLAEAALLRRYGPELRAEVLVAPEHGAGDAPLADFIAAVQPRYVLFSNGYRNRFGFPKRQTVRSYREAGAAVLDTAQEGAISFRLEDGKLAPESYRGKSRRYWRVD
jgi:competence protein ComEC